jgi:hypothetical protein
LSKRDVWQDELDEEFGEFDENVSYWAEDLVETQYGVVPEQSDSYIPPDKNVLRAEKHNRRLRKQQAAERRSLDT